MPEPRGMASRCRNRRRGIKAPESKEGYRGAGTEGRGIEVPEPRGREFERTRI
jgi:hypothetical protein